MKHNKKIEINIIDDDDDICMDFMPDTFYEDGSVSIYREDIIYLLDDKDHEVANHFVKKWSEEENEDIQKFTIDRRVNTGTPEGI